MHCRYVLIELEQSYLMVNYVIIVLEMGEIVEMGNHAELMALNGKYHELFSAQAERYINYLDKNEK